MSEKEKGKIQPFAGDLQSDEEVLWMMPYPGSLSSILWRAALMLAAFEVFVLVIILGNAHPTEERTLVLFLMNLVASPFILGWVLDQRRIMNSTWYGITSERLLYRDDKKVLSLAIENVPAGLLYIGKDGKGTFGFGDSFPTWSNVEDPATVEELMVNVYKKRMKQIGK